MNVLYLDCFSGISGDMTVGALLDLGADPAALQAGLASLGLKDWHVRIERGRKGVLAGTAFRTESDPGQAEEERHLEEIETLIHRADLPPAVRHLAVKTFRLLAKAEAEVHGIPVERVHFHEVGAGDAILDIVGAALCMNLLKPDRVIVSPIPMARGFVTCRHGQIPLPAPATLLLAKGVPIQRPPAPTVRELATPTGLAIARATADAFGDLPEGTVSGVGCGLGQLDFDWPNVLRAILIQVDGTEAGHVCLIETNLDDMTSEVLAHALERVLACDALDAWLTPIHMKKGRPGLTFSVLCQPGDRDRLVQEVLKETTTLGVRFSTLDRVTLPREVVAVETPFGPIRCKVARPEGGTVKVKPEFEDCRAAAERSGEPFMAVAEAALEAFKTLL